jgi:hypothetical protein
MCANLSLSGVAILCWIAQGVATLEPEPEIDTSDSEDFNTLVFIAGAFIVLILLEVVLKVK